MLIEPMRSEWRLRLNALGCAVVAFCSLGFCSSSNPGGLNGAWFLGAVLCLIAVFLIAKPANRNVMEYGCCVLTLCLVLLTTIFLGENLSDYHHMMSWISDPCFKLQQTHMPN